MTHTSVFADLAPQSVEQRLTKSHGLRRDCGQAHGIVIGQPKLLGYVVRQGLSWLNETTIECW